MCTLFKGSTVLSCIVIIVGEVFFAGGSLTFEPVGPSTISTILFITDDDIVEGIEQVFVSLSTSDQSVEFTVSEMSYFILDNDGKCTETGTRG